MRVNPKVERFVKENGSTILTCVSVAGVVGTSVLTAKATVKAIDILNEAKKENGENLTMLEKMKLAIPVYIPSMIMGASTIACIVGTNVFNKKHQAYLLSAYTMLDQSYKEYKDKVIDLYGAEADEKIEEELEKDNCPRR